jgi:adenosine deaminase
MNMSSIQGHSIDGCLSWSAREAIRRSIVEAHDPFVHNLPKAELHIHIEGTLTPELRWELACRNGMTLKLERTGKVYTSVDDVKAAYGVAEIRPGNTFDNEEEKFTFFEMYYGGFEVLKTKEDFYDLAMGYFRKAASMNVRYCEPFFDPQGHVRRGVTWQAMMDGFRAAQQQAEKELNVSSHSIHFIYCFLTLSAALAMDHVLHARPVSRVRHGTLQGFVPIPRHDRRHRTGLGRAHAASYAVQRHLRACAR